MSRTVIEQFDDLTVFLITVGASSYPACREALAAQDCEFVLDEIKDVAPMSAAFQQMLDRCRTPLFIQGDEDMVLRSTAVRTMRDRMLEVMREDSSVAMIAFPLWDVHLGRTLMGMKIYRHEAMVQAPYRDVQSCEMDQLKRLQSLGFTYRTEWGRPWEQHVGALPQDDPMIMGLHGTTYTPREAFERYKDLAEKYRRVGGSDWVAPWLQRFLERSLGKSVDLGSADLWSALGLASGLMACTPREACGSPGEKDFTAYPSMPDFGELMGHLTPWPQRVDVHMTRECNLRCSWCRRQRLEPPRWCDDWNALLVGEVLSKLPSIRGATIAGFGEPLMSPRLGEVIRAFGEHGVQTSLITNGTLIEERFDSTPWGALTSVNVSLNEVDPDRHAELTGVTGAFDRAVAGFDLLVRVGVRVGFSFVITLENWRRIPAYLRFSAEHGARFVSLFNVLPHHDTGCSEQNEAFWKIVLSDHDPDFAGELPGFKSLAADLGLDVNSWPVPISRHGVNPKRCRSPWEAIGINGSGLYTGCFRVKGPGPGEDPETGYIKAGDFWHEDILLVNLRRALAGCGPLPPRCTMCFGCWAADRATP